MSPLKRVTKCTSPNSSTGTYAFNKFKTSSNVEPTRHHAENVLEVSRRLHGDDHEKEPRPTKNRKENLYYFFTAKYGTASMLLIN